MTDYTVSNDAELQTALANQQNGDTITLKAGSYSTHIVITADDVTLLGAKADAPLDATNRNFGESILNGGVELQGNGATVNGVEVTAAGSSGTYGAIEVSGDDAHVTSINFLGSDNSNDPPAGHPSAAISLEGTATGFVSDVNTFRGFVDGIYAVEGSHGTIHGNLFDQDGSGVVTESDGVIVSGNQFQNSVGADVAVVVYANEDLSTIIHPDNSFDDTHGRKVSIFVQETGLHIVGTDYADAYNGDYLVNGASIASDFSGGMGADNIFGGDLADTFSGGEGNDTITSNAGNDNIFGGNGSDSVIAAGGDDTIDGGGGVDRLFGGDGRDQFFTSGDGDFMSGGAGRDKYSFSALESATSATLGGFDQLDIIDLRKVDADTTAKGNQAFTNVTETGGFDHHAGELLLSYNAATNRTTIKMDTDGDGKSDHQILLLGGDFHDFSHFQY